MNILNKIFYITLSVSAVGSAWADQNPATTKAPKVKQECDARGIRSTPTTDFIINGDGTVFHKKTGLTWTQCPVSNAIPDATVHSYDWKQYLDAKGNCTGASPGPLYVGWIEFAGFANYLSMFKGEAGWRLPSIQELASLQEEHCINPSINTEVFKMTPEYLLNWVNDSADNQDKIINFGFLSSTFYNNYNSTSMVSTPVYFSFPVNTDVSVNGNLASMAKITQSGTTPASDKYLVLLVRDDK